MHKAVLRVAGKAVVVLGAGATRGASFVDGLSARAPHPPLDGDFFNELEKLREEAPVKTFLGAYRAEFGSVSPLGMEAFFTQIEFLDLLHQHVNIGLGRTVQKYRKLQEQFLEALCCLFNRFLANAECAYHARIAEILQSGDAIISYNYDTVIDTALKEHGTLRWRPAEGYGLNVTGGGAHWTPGTVVGRPARTSIRLLKMHGSLNWNRNGQTNNSVVLAARPYAPKDIAIIPPMWNKPIVTDTFYTEIWRSARTVSPNVAKLDALLVANPDADAQERTIRLLSPAIESDTLVLRLNSMRELAQYLGAQVL